MRWLVGLMVTLTAIVGGTYLGLAWILEAVIVQQALARGVVVSELHVQRPTWGIVIIDRIALTVDSAEVQAENVAIGFTWDSLSQGRATDVTLSGLGVVVRSDDSVVGGSSAQTFDAGELIGALPVLLAGTWQAVPARSLAAAEVRAEIGEISFAGVMAFSQVTASLQGRVDGPQPVPPLQIVVRVEPGGAVHVEARDAEVVDNVLQIDADLGSATGTLAGSWGLEPAADGSPIAATVIGSAPFALADSGWLLESGLAVTLVAADWQAEFDVIGGEGSWRPDPEALAQVRGNWRGSLQLEAAGIRAVGSASATVGATVVQITVDPQSVVNVTRMAGADWPLAGARLELVDTARLQVGLQSRDYVLQGSTRLAVQLDRFAFSDYELSPFVDLTLQELNGNSAQMAAPLQVQMQAQVPALGFDGSAQVQGSLASGSYAIEFTGEQSIAAPLLAGLFRDEARTYDVDVGQIRARGALQVGGDAAGGLSGAVSLAVTGLGAHYGDITASNVAGELTVAFEDGAWRVGPDRVTVGVVDVGFPITDLTANLALRPESLALSGLRGRTLGGEVRVEDLEYQIATGSSRFLVETSGLSLAEILALEGDTITGRGTLDGQLPVQVADKEVRVSDGRFSARPPGGVLSYGGAEDAAASLNQPGVGFAIAALGDFRYGVLDVGVTYEPNGDLLLGIHLEGNNPRFEAGRPIHYNLNISENIPVLLQSLQLSDEVGKQLEKRLIQ